MAKTKSRALLRAETARRLPAIPAWTPPAGPTRLQFAAMAISRADGPITATGDMLDQTGAPAVDFVVAAGHLADPAVHVRLGEILAAHRDALGAARRPRYARTAIYVAIADRPHMVLGGSPNSNGGIAWFVDDLAAQTTVAIDGAYTTADLAKAIAVIAAAPTA